MTVLTAFFTRFHAGATFQSWPTKREWAFFSSMKSFNQSPSSAEHAPQMYALADIQNYSWNELKYYQDLWIQKHIVPHLEVLRALVCSGHVYRSPKLDSFGFFYTNNLQSKFVFSRGLAEVVPLTQTDVFFKYLCNRTIPLLVDCGEKKNHQLVPKWWQAVCESLVYDDPINKWIISFLNNFLNPEVISSLS